MRFQDDVVLVVGGAMGIGKATAELVAREGATVAIADIAETEAANVAKTLGDSGTRAISVAMDITDPLQIQACIDEVVRQFGRIDVLVITVGRPAIGPALDATFESLQEILAVNLVGLFVTSQAVAREMVKQGHGGRIVLLSSLAGLNGTPLMASYSAAKHGVIGMTKVFAIEWGQYDIRVNCICPGPTITPLYGTQASTFVDFSRIPIGRAGTANEQAEAIAFLASRESAFVNGVAFAVDGGAIAIGGHINTGALQKMQEPR